MGVVAAMLTFVSAAHAGGVNMRWSNCFGEGSGTDNRTFGCASNAGTNILVCSFVLDADVAQVSGNELVVDFISQSPTLPLWWEMKDAGTCRAPALGFNTVANSNDLVCIDWAQAQSTGGIGAYNANLGSIDGAFAAQHRRLVIALATALAGFQDLVSNTEYFSCNIPISNVRTVGTPSCTGCTTPVCIVLNSLKVTTFTGADDVTLGTGTAPGTNVVTWQGTGADCAAVPTKNVTWGAVKALYR
jgi:hypothetical protein